MWFLVSLVLHSSKDLVMSYVFNVVEKQKNALCCVKLRCKFRFCGARGAAPDQTPQNRPVKEDIRRRCSFTGRLCGVCLCGRSRRLAKPFSANCKRVQVGRMRGLLEMLLEDAPSGFSDKVVHVTIKCTRYKIQ